MDPTWDSKEALNLDSENESYERVNKNHLSKRDAAGTTHIM